jgi:hypothetical protein
MTGLLRKHLREDSGLLLGRGGWEAIKKGENNQLQASMTS